MAERKILGMDVDELVDHVGRTAEWMSRRNRLPAYQDHEDVAQEVLIKLLETKPETGSNNPIIYATRAVRNMYVDISRKKKLNVSRIDPEGLEMQAYDTSVEDNDEYIDLRGKVMNLLQNQKEVIIRRYFYGQNSKTIEEITGLSSNAITTANRLALERLRVKLTI